MKNGYWTPENIQAAKRLVRQIVQLADARENALTPGDIQEIISTARQIRTAVESNQRTEEIRLPL